MQKKKKLKKYLKQNEYEYIYIYNTHKKYDLNFLPLVRHLYKLLGRRQKKKKHVNGRPLKKIPDRQISLKRDLSHRLLL